MSSSDRAKERASTVCSSYVEICLTCAAHMGVVHVITSSTAQLEQVVPSSTGVSGIGNIRIVGLILNIITHDLFKKFSNGVDESALFRSGHHFHCRTCACAFGQRGGGRGSALRDHGDYVPSSAW